MLSRKKEIHNKFWQGEGPCLMLIPAAQNSLYDLNDYRRRFYDPTGMWKSEMARTCPLVDWPSDGIPTVRPNLGVIFVPAIAGQDFQIPQDSMPWPGKPLSFEKITAARQVDVDKAELFELARQFYEIHRESSESAEIAVYLPDTQGVFDIAHLLLGDEIFYDLADPDQTDTISELMDNCFILYERCSVALKKCLGEDLKTMIHGHGTEQGLFFPNAGVRISEDTATLLSPAMIENIILPTVKRCAEYFGGVFVHYCGYHESFLRQLAELSGVKAIDLGNPEMYNTRNILQCCAETDTVLYSRLAAEPGEDWRSYTERLARLVRDTNARVVQRPLIYPESRQECRDMLDLWHEKTI